MEGTVLPRPAGRLLADGVDMMPPISDLRRSLRRAGGILTRGEAIRALNGSCVGVDALAGFAQGEKMR